MAKQILDDKEERGLAGTVTMKVSDCHHGKYETIDIKQIDASFEKKEMYVCKVCNQECKVVEFLVEDNR